MGARMVTIERHNTPQGERFEAWTLHKSKRQPAMCVRLQVFAHTDCDEQRRWNYYRFVEPLVLQGYHIGVSRLRNREEVLNATN